jgi:hypothetical protein
MKLAILIIVPRFMDSSVTRVFIEFFVHILSIV